MNLNFTLYTNEVTFALGKSTNIANSDMYSDICSTENCR